MESEEARQLAEYVKSKYELTRGEDPLDGALEIGYAADLENSKRMEALCSGTPKNVGKLLGGVAATVLERFNPPMKDASAVKKYFYNQYCNDIKKTAMEVLKSREDKSDDE